MARTAVLILSTHLDDAVGELAAAIRAHAGDAVTVFHCLDVTGGGEVPVDREDVFTFTLEQVFGMGYAPIGETLVPGNNHLPLFYFARERGPYDHYWLIENDVRFTGAWAELMGDQDEGVDLLTTHVQPYERAPHWMWWSTFQSPDGRLPIAVLRSFNPIYRISKRAIETLGQLFASGWRGHHEVALPSLVHMAGLRIEEFGGTGPFVARGREDRYYQSGESHPDGWLEGSMRYCPAWDPKQMEPGLLYHPVKQGVEA